MPWQGGRRSRPWWALSVLSLAQLMVVLDATVVNIALPHAQANLHFSNGDRQWVVTAYTLTFGTLLLLGGRVADLFGRERVLLGGIVGFAVASSLGGAAVDFPMLVTARALQGGCGALLAPAALSLVTTSFPSAADRTKALGIYSGVAAAGASIGLLVGGVLTEYLDWRWTLYVNVMLAGVTLAGALLLLEPATGRRHGTLDITGTLLVSSGLFAIVYAFAHAAEQPGARGWGDSLTIGLMVLGGALLVAFVAFESRSRHPLLPLRIVGDRNRGGAYLALFVAAVGTFAVFLFLTYYLEDSLGYSAVRCGVAFLPVTGLILVSAGFTNTVLTSRVGPRVLIPLGLVVAALGLVLLTGIGLRSSYAATVLPGSAVFGTGLGVVFASAFGLGTLGVAEEDAGVASAVLNVANQVGGSVGVALLNTIATTAAASYVAAHRDASVRLVPARAALHSYIEAFWVAATIYLGAAVLVGLVLRPGVPDPAVDELALA